MAENNDPFRDAERWTRCPKCGETYGWNVEDGLAGQRCRCGYTFKASDVRRKGRARNEKTIRLKLGMYWIEISLTGDGKGGAVQSNLHEPCDKCGDHHCDCEDGPGAFNHAIDGIESLVLGHACAGVDITTPEYIDGIKTAVEACGNNL